MSAPIIFIKPWSGAGVSSLWRVLAVGSCTPPNQSLVASLSSRQSRAMASKAVNIGNLNPRLIKLEYAVRGPLVKRAAGIEEELRKGVKKPFKKVIRANIGDAHAMGQKPITFIRQVLACCTDPQLIQSANYPEDVKKRATEFLSGCGGKSVGAYTKSLGIDRVRKNVAEYIERRDGFPAKFENICVTAGASSAIKSCLQMFCKDIDGKPSGVMVPIPQYPLYSATLAEFGLELVGYYLDETKNWGLDSEELERAKKEAQSRCAVRALVVINPGNPTGQVLSRDNIRVVLKFANKHNLFVFADEVYQDNVYAKGLQFHSFKKVLMEMGSKYSNQELASYMTVSKGYMGECGLRGGWVELVGLEPQVQTHLYKTISVMLCPTVLGQATVDCVAKPPVEGEPSYELWKKEKEAVLASLKSRAQMVVSTFNKMEGFSCNEVQGAMYAFPNFKLPEKALENAKAKKQAPDVYYVFQLLEQTGICVVPGSGFEQKPGSYHFRTTILPQKDLLLEMLEIFQKFQVKFLQEHK